MNGRQASGTEKAKPAKHRTAFLTLVFTLVVFVIFTVTTVTMGLLGYLLVQSGVWTFHKGGGDQVLFSMLAYIVASIGVGTVLALSVGRLPFRPVNRLIRGMKRLAGGDYGVRLPEGRSGFGREISDSFNMLAEELENTEVLRSDFVNSFSHEFKTPIVSIQGFAQLLNRGGLTEKQEREYLGIIEEESRRLAAMATGVLNYSRIENQKILTGMSRYNLSEQIRTCILLLEKKWSEKNLKLSLDFQEHAITANEEMLKQVWINLLDNAVKFTPEQGSIEVFIREAAGRIQVCIRNSGTEISPEEQNRIFQKFYRGDRSHSREGTGLGLTIAKRIVELHGGEISVESGGGKTTFAVELKQTAALS